MKLRHLLPLFVFGAIGLFLLGGIGKDPRVVPSPLIDKPAPEFTLPSLHEPDTQVTAASLRGKPYLLNVWGSWCVMCREEHATLTQIANSGEVALVGLNWKDTAEDAKRWLVQYGDPYTTIAHDPEGRTAIDFGVYGAPETFLVDAQGVIRYKFVGPMQPQDYAREFQSRLRAMGAAK